MLYLIYIISIFVLRLVTLEIAYSLVSFFAKIKYIFAKRDRDIVKKNLRNIMPGACEKEISLLAVAVFKNFGKYLVDFFSLIKNQRDYLKNNIRISGVENLRDALKSGRGCIVISAHFGNWELGGCALADLGFKINAIVLAHLDPRINNLFINLRRLSGVNIIPLGFARTAYQEALCRNEVIAILGDRPFGDRGIEVTFFGKKAIVPRGAALLSLKTGAPIILTFSFKEDTNKNYYKLVLDKPFMVKREGALNNQLKEITQRFINRFEDYIKKYPSQWYMFNKVWTN